MIQYMDNGEELLFDGMIIPKDEGNRHYTRALREVAAGLAEIVPATGPSLAEVYNAKILELNAACGAALAALGLEYPPEERDTWPDQRAEALAYTAYLAAVQTDPETPAPSTPFLDAVCAARGMPHADFAARVLAKPVPWLEASGERIGKRLNRVDQADAIVAGAGSEQEKIAAIQAITW